jgi:uncharacterized membrane protein YidH (DUF202 family)
MTTILKFVQAIIDTFINPLLALLFSVAFLLFFFGLFRFMTNEQGSQEYKNGKNHMLWSIIGIFVMLSVTAILAVFMRTLGFTQADLPTDLPFKL